MSPYLPLHLKWRFTTKEGRAQFKSLFYRIYINVFAIFLEIPILPFGFDKDTLNLYYHGDEIFWIWPWRRDYFKKKYNNGKPWMSLNCNGSFNSLAEIDEFWNSYWKACEQKDIKND